MRPRSKPCVISRISLALLFAVLSGAAFAYSDYGGCQSCHGGFDGNNYTSKTDNVAWGKNLMEGHETTLSVFDV